MIATRLFIVVGSEGLRERGEEGEMGVWQRENARNVAIGVSQRGKLSNVAIGAGQLRESSIVACKPGEPSIGVEQLGNDLKNVGKHKKPPICVPSPHPRPSLHNLKEMPIVRSK